MAIAGYLAFGNSVPSSILMAFHHPVWLVNLAQFLIIFHMLPAYQMYLQPLMAFVEGRFKNWDRAPEWSKVIWGGGRQTVCARTGDG